MKKKIRISGYGLTSLRSAKRLVLRGRARWIGETSIEIIVEDRSPIENFHARAKVLQFPVREAVQIQDAFPGMPVLPTIGYNRAGVRLSA
jgi:hypothetical protein